MRHRGAYSQVLQGPLLMAENMAVTPCLPAPPLGGGDRAGPPDQLTQPGGRVEMHRIQAKFPRSVMVWGAVPSAGAGVFYQVRASFQHCGGC